MFSDTSPSAARLLLCDDSPVERLALAHFLRRTGYDVDEAGDGEAAILHIKHRPVDALLLDLNMPDVDGFAVAGFVNRITRAAQEMRQGQALYGRIVAQQQSRLRW